jgi:hypothetical protein
VLKWMCAAALGLTGAATAMAEPMADSVSPSGVRTYRIDEGVDRRAAIVVRPITNSAATVSRGLSEQPVRPFMIEVRVGNTTTFIDPDVDYRGTGPGKLDEGHWIIRAQRKAAEVRGTHVVYGRDHAKAEVRGEEIRPSMILLRPSLKAKQPGAMPTVPTKPQESKTPKGSVASAE